MANEDNKPEDQNGDPSSDIPEVEAEIVEEGEARPASATSSATASAAGEDDEDAKKTTGEETAAGESGGSPSGRTRPSTLTPGVILFCVFAVVALSVIAVWRIQGGGQAPQSVSEDTASQSAVGGDAQSDSEAEDGEPPAATVPETNESPAAVPNSSDVASTQSDAAEEEAGDNLNSGAKPAEGDASETITALPSASETAKIDNFSNDDLKTADTTIDLNGDLSSFKDALPEAGAEKIAQSDGPSFQEAAKDALDSLGAAADESTATETDDAQPISGFDVETNEAVDGTTPDLSDEIDAAAPLEPTDASLNTQNSAPVIDTAALDAAQQENEKLQNDLAALKEAFDRERSELTAAFDQERNQLAAALEEERQRNESQRDEIDTLRQDFQSAIDAKNEEADAQTRDLAARLQKIENEEILPARQRVASVAALRELEISIASGAPFEAALSRLERAAPNAPAVDALRIFASDGVATNAALKADFSAAARAALAAGRKENATDFLSVLKAQAVSLFSVRPAEPKSGDSIGAIMSRAEYAVENNDLETALRELEAMPPSGRDAMSDWVSSATAHVTASSAIETLNQFIAGAMANQ